MCQTRMNLRRATAIVGFLLAAACSAPSTSQAPAPAATDVTVFEGARLIVGDGAAPIENAVFVVENDRFVQVGRAGDVQSRQARRA